MQNKNWIGYWIMLVALLHTIASFLFFMPAYQEIWQRGIVNAIGRNLMPALGVWFFMFGVVLALLGLCVRSLEQHQAYESARTLAVGLFLMSLLGVILMPDSGFWLMFPATIALYRLGARQKTS